MAPKTSKMAESGVPGLDDVLSGGFTRGSLFLVEGNPGTGKSDCDFCWKGKKPGSDLFTSHCPRPKKNWWPAPPRMDGH